MINVQVKTGLTDVACHSELSSCLKAPYQEESSENKLVKQLVSLARRYLCVLLFIWSCNTMVILAIHAVSEAMQI